MISMQTRPEVTSIPGPDEVERCACDESVALRQALASKQRQLDAVVELSNARPDARRAAVTSAWEANGGDGLD
jgi:hypothetical protein